MSEELRKKLSDAAKRRWANRKISETPARIARAAKKEGMTIEVDIRLNVDGKQVTLSLREAERLYAALGDILHRQRHELDAK